MKIKNISGKLIYIGEMLVLDSEPVEVDNMYSSTLEALEKNGMVVIVEPAPKKEKADAESKDEDKSKASKTRSRKTNEDPESEKEPEPVKEEAV